MAHRSKIASRHPPHQSPKPCRHRSAQDSPPACPRQTSPYRKRSSAQVQARKQLLIGDAREALDIDPQRIDHSFRHWRIRLRALNRISAAKAQHLRATDIELIPLGMAAKIIKRIEQQNARIRPRRLPIETRRSQPADAASDNHQVIALARRFRSAGMVPEVAVTHRMSHGIRALIQCRASRSSPADNSPEHSAPRVHRARRRTSLRMKPMRNRSRANTHRHAVHEIAARDPAPHAQLFIAIGHSILIE